MNDNDGNDVVYDEYTVFEDEEYNVIMLKYDE